MIPVFLSFSSNHSCCEQEEHLTHPRSVCTVLGRDATIPARAQSWIRRIEQNMTDLCTIFTELGLTAGRILYERELN